MSTFTVKRGDTGPALVYALSPSSVVLSGATVVANMRNRQTGVVKINRKPATIVTASGSPTVKYAWAAGDLDTAGTYDFEFEVTYLDGTVETFPNSPNPAFITVIVTGDIA